MGKKRAKILEGDDEEKGKDGKKKKQKTTRSTTKLTEHKEKSSNFWTKLNFHVLPGKKKMLGSFSL